MKKLTRLFTVLLAVILISGCVKYEVEMDIHNDKSMDFSLIYAIDTSNGMDISEMGLDIDELKESLKDDKFEVSEYKEDSYSGVKVTKKYKNIDNISSKNEKEVILTDLLETDNYDDSQLFKVKKGIMSNTYSAHFIFDLSDTDEEYGDYSSYANSMEFKYTLKLPYKVGKNNADSVSSDGKTLTWNVNFGEKKDIQFTFDIKNNKFIYAIVGIVGLIVVVIIAVLVKKNKPNNNKGNVAVQVSDNNVEATSVNNNVQDITMQPIQNETNTTINDNMNMSVSADTNLQNNVNQDINLDTNIQSSTDNIDNNTGVSEQNDVNNINNGNGNVNS